MNDELTMTTPSDVELKTVRTFEAPRSLVFEAHAKAEHLKHWWGRGNPVDVEIDFRPGGAYRFVEHAPDGVDYAFHGEYKEIDPPARIVYTFEYEGEPNYESVVTVEFTEQDGRTTITSTSRFGTRQERDQMIDVGAETGMRQSYEALAAYLAKMPTA